MENFNVRYECNDGRFLSVFPFRFLPTIRLKTQLSQTIIKSASKGLNPVKFTAWSSIEHLNTHPVHLEKR